MSERATWSGLCPAGKHGLDYEGQRCDLCPKGETMDPKRMSPTTASVLLENLRDRGQPLGHVEAVQIANELERARASEARLERELLAIAEATGFVNRPEGQGGYERATGERIAHAFRERDEEVARLERENEELREANSKARGLLVVRPGSGCPCVNCQYWARDPCLLDDVRAALRTAATEDGRARWPICSRCRDHNASAKDDVCAVCREWESRGVQTRCPYGHGEERCMKAAEPKHPLHVTRGGGTFAGNAVGVRMFQCAPLPTDPPRAATEDGT